ENAHLHVVVLGGLDESAQIFRKAGATETGPSVQKFRSDPVVEPHTTGNFLHVGANLFTEIGDFVDETDFGSKKCVGRVLDELSRAASGEEDWSPVQIKRAVDLGQNGLGALIVRSNHNPIGMFKIMDCSTFPQEFRI